MVVALLFSIKTSVERAKLQVFDEKLGVLISEQLSDLELNASLQGSQLD